MKPVTIWARPLSDGAIAVGLLNFGDQKVKVTAEFAKLGLTGTQPVRDLWQQQNLGGFFGPWSAEISVHGAVMGQNWQPEIGELMPFGLRSAPTYERNYA